MSLFLQFLRASLDSVGLTTNPKKPLTEAFSCMFHKIHENRSVSEHQRIFQSKIIWVAPRNVKFAFYDLYICLAVKSESRAERVGGYDPCPLLFMEEINFHLLQFSSLRNLRL